MTRALDPTPDGAAATILGRAATCFPIDGRRETFANAGEADVGRGHRGHRRPAPSRSTLDAAVVDVPATGSPSRRAGPCRRRPSRSAARTSPTGPWAPARSSSRSGTRARTSRWPATRATSTRSCRTSTRSTSTSASTRTPRSLRLETGEADGVFEQLSPSSRRPCACWRQNPTVTVTDSVGPRIFYLALNNDGILGNKDLRQAVAQAMTTDFVAQFGDLAKPWNQLMGSTTAQSDPEGTTTYPHDPEAAAALLESAGYDGTPDEDRLRRHRPLHVGQLDRARPGPRGGRLHGRAQAASSRPSSSATAGIYDSANYDISSTYWSADYPDAQDYFSTNFVCGHRVPQHLALLRRGHRRAPVRDRARCPSARSATPPCSTSSSGSSTRWRACP